VIALPLAYFVRDEPQTEDTEADGSPPRKNTQEHRVGPPRKNAEEHGKRAQSPSIGYVFRSPAFYLLAIGSMCSIGAVGGTNQHLKLYLSLDQQYSQTAAATIASTVLAFSIAGRLFMGWLADRVPRKLVMLIIYLLIVCSIPLLFMAHTPAAMYAFAVIFGLGLGGEYLIIPLMAADLFGVRVLGRLLGVILTADGVAEATVPMLVGHLRDTTGSYTTGFLTLIAIAIAGTLAIAWLPGRTAPSTEAHV